MSNDSSLAARQNSALRLLRDAGILPIVTVDSLDQARAVAEALQRGGLHSIELTLRTPVALAAMAMLKYEYPALVVGAGTVLTRDHIAAHPFVDEETEADTRSAEGVNADT